MKERTAKSNDGNWRDHCLNVSPTARGVVTSRLRVVLKTEESEDQMKEQSCSTPGDLYETLISWQLPAHD
jgi:hypothetical protein